MHNPPVIAASDLTETKGLSDIALTCMVAGMTAESAEQIARVFFPQRPQNCAGLV